MEQPQKVRSKEKEQTPNEAVVICPCKQLNSWVSRIFVIWD